MKNIFRSIDKRISTLLLLGVAALLLALFPIFYGSIISLFAMLDQHMLFNIFLIIAVLGLVFYVSIEARKHLHVPYAVSALIFGIAGHMLWNTIVNIDSSVYIAVGIAITSFAVFRHGLLVDFTGSQKTFWKNIFSGVVIAVVLFIVTNMCLGFFFPELSEAMRYSGAVILLLLGAHVPGKILNSMGAVRFAFDMTLLVIAYNFLLFSSRILPDSLMSISQNIALYSSAITSSVYGVLIGLIGAYFLHRHHKIWVSAGQSSKENIYTLTLLSGVLALSILIGANPFIAAGIMGLLVTLRDAKENPEDHILVKTESAITIIVFLILGASISLQSLIGLAPFGAVMTLFVTIVAMVGIGLLFFVFGKINFLPRAHIKSYMAEVYQRSDSTLMAGALTLFAAAYLRMEYLLLITLAIVFSITVEYVYPWVLRVVKHDTMHK